MPDPTDESSDEGGPVIRPFTEVLVQTARGRTLDELSNGLHALIAAVQDTGKAGSLVLKLDVKPVNKGDGNTLVVTDTVTVKTPNADRPASIFFVDAEGNLTRNDPRQMTLPLRDAAQRRNERQAQ